MMKIRRFLFPLGVVGSGIGIAVLIKDAMRSAMYEGEEKLYGRTVVITGASSGLGKETARDLAKRGGRIVMGCRNMEKCQQVREEIITETFNKQVQCYKLNLASLASIREFAEQVNQNEKRVDILINNAGLMAVEDRTLTQDGFELQLGVNFLGPFLLTNLLLDKLKASAPSRIINVTCSAYRKGRFNFKDFNSALDYNPKIAYCSSKLALYTFGLELADRLKDTKVTVYNLHPGTCLTDIGQHMGRSKLQISRSLLHPLWRILLKSPTEGIQTTLYCALHPDEAFFSGQYYEDCSVLYDTALVSRAQPHAKRLWAVAERWTRLVED